MTFFENYKLKKEMEQKKQLLECIKSLNKRNFNYDQQDFFVTGDIRIYIDSNHTKSILANKNVALLKTMQQGYVPLEYFPESINNKDDEYRIKQICSRIIELENEAMIDIMSNCMGVTGSMLAHVFIPNDIIIGDDTHAYWQSYVPYVDKKTVVPSENICDSHVKKLIKENYIDKI